MDGESKLPMDLEASLDPMGMVASHDGAEPKAEPSTSKPSDANPSVPAARDASPSASAARDATSRNLARLIATGFLVGVIVSVGYGVLTAFFVSQDAFVAPVILSPDSDIVLTNRLKMSELQVERARAVADLEGCEADLQAARAGLERLATLRETATKSRGWYADVAMRQEQVAAEEIRTLAGQRAVLREMVTRQMALANRARNDLASALISRDDYAREVRTLDQMHVAVFDNERATQRSRALHQESMRARASLAGRSGVAQMPEILALQEQVVRIEMEVLRLEADSRTRTAQKRALAERIAQIDELAAQLEARPFLRATDRTLDMAFVPYTQIDGVETGAPVYACVWGLFFCDPVGTVTELVPGEVLLPDPWGSPARGQYAVLDLESHDVARSKILRVRRPSVAALSFDTPPRAAAQDEAHRADRRHASSMTRHESSTTRHESSTTRH